MSPNINRVLWSKKDGLNDIPLQLVGLTFEKDGKKKVADRDFIIGELKLRKITKVRSKGQDTVDPVEWINRVYGGKESNYIHVLFFQTVFHEFLFSDPKRMDEYFLYKNIPSKKLYRLFPYSKGQLKIIIGILVESEIIEVTLTKIPADRSGKRENFQRVTGFIQDSRVIGYRMIQNPLNLLIQEALSTTRSG